MSATNYRELIELLYGEPPAWSTPDIMEALRHIDHLDEDVLPLLPRLLTTGSQTARSKVRTAFVNIITAFQNAYSASEEASPEDYESRDNEWERFLDGYERPTIRNNLLGVWNAANVVGEASGDYSVDQIIEGMGSIPFYVDDVDPDSDAAAAGDSYWRGIAATAIIRFRNSDFIIMKTDAILNAVPGFIEWAGAHDDIAKVISLAVERSSFDRCLLEGIIAEQQGANALSPGVL